MKRTIQLSLNIRKQYRDLEIKHHGSEWMVEEDVLVCRFSRQANHVPTGKMAQR